MKLELIDDVGRRWWRLLSVQAMALAGAVQGTWAVFADDLKQNIPHWLVTTITLGLLMAGIGGRLIKQDPPKPGAD